jgi:hypothetical protein
MVQRHRWFGEEKQNERERVGKKETEREIEREGGREFYSRNTNFQQGRAPGNAEIRSYNKI